MFNQRVLEPELLDHVPAEVARPNLADLVRINRRFGGHSVLRKTLKKLTDTADVFTLLDVGAASGDSAQVVKSIYPRARITSLDYNSVNLEQASYPKLIADAFHLPFGEGSFDYVLSSLFLHHFNDSEILKLLRSFYEVARKAVIICDLERHVLPYLFLRATRRIFGWNRITVHDGLISVRASFRKCELNKLASEAGIDRAEMAVYRPAFRLAMIGRK